MTKNIKKEIKEFTELINKYPLKEDLYIGRAFLYMEIKQYKKAAEDFKKAHTNYTAYDIYSVCEREDLIAEAEKLYTKAINDDKSNFLNYTKRAGFYTRIGRTEKALADCETALKLNPNDKIIPIIIETLIKKIDKTK